MVLSSDPFWNDVEEMNDGSIKCKFCRRTFAKDTSISRIKWHLSGEKGHGVAICDQVPKDVQEAAFLARRGGNKRQKTIASSSNVNDNAIASCPQEENNEVNNLAGDAGRIQKEVQTTEQGVGEERTTSCAEAGNHMENMTGEMMHIDRMITLEGLIGDAQDTRGETRQVTEKLSQVDIERTDWQAIATIAQLMEEEDVDNETEGLLKPVADMSTSGGLACNTSETKGDALPTSSTMPVGRAFEDNKNVIQSWLMNDEVSIIGIYGMGGVGKTTLLKHICNQLQERSHHVYWITVSQTFSINRLQNLIAKRIGLDLSTENDELHRAFELSKTLQKKQKWFLILDDLWNYFELDKVGIPVQMKGCKLILTTRSKTVCQRMDSQNKIKVKPLFDREAWNLFLEKLGHDIALPPEVEQIAKFITKECAGLPLGIITMAGAMKGVDDIHEWRNALEELKQSRVRKDDMEEEVFRILRFSYMHLNDSALQQCFLYCALFPEDFMIPREDLIAYLIDEGVIKGPESREAEFDKGHSMLNKLENVCLLENCQYFGDRAVKMHDLIRDMAIQIQQENSPVIVQAGTQLKELPHADEWTQNLVRVSLMKNHILQIPLSHSPRCPNLSTLLLCSNPNMRSITYSFFKQLHGLKVLNLSETSIRELPDSVSDLVNLSALLLKSCWDLRHVPSLKNFRALKRLDLSNTALEKMPQGLKQLSNLRYLRLNGCGQKEFPSGILPKLSHLQVLIIEELVDRKYAPVTLKGKEVACLRKLETLECHFENLSDFAEYLKSRDETHSLSSYKFCVGHLDERAYTMVTKVSSRSKTVGLDSFSINRDEDLQVFPNDIQELMISKCNDPIRSLWDVSSLKCAPKLEDIYIEDCNGMESLVSSSWFCSALPPIPSSGIFSGLKEFYCCGATSMKKVFPLVLLPNLVNLEVIMVVDCEKMEEIIATGDIEEGVMGEESSSTSSNSINIFNLPKLRILTLCNLQELKSFCNAKLICDSLEEIEVRGCQKLKRMPFSIPLLDNGQPSPPPCLRRMEMDPKEWWESVLEWEHPNTKDVLLPLVEFQNSDTTDG